MHSPGRTRRQDNEEERANRYENMEQLYGSEYLSCSLSRRNCPKKHRKARRCPKQAWHKTPREETNPNPRGFHQSSETPTTALSDELLLLFFFFWPPLKQVKTRRQVKISFSASVWS